MSERSTADIIKDLEDGLCHHHRWRARGWPSTLAIVCDECLREAAARLRAQAEHERTRGPENGGIRRFGETIIGGSAGASRGEP